MMNATDIVSIDPNKSSSERIHSLSRHFIGISYSTTELIGSSQSIEKLVLIPQKFDCVTYCETVISAAFSHNKDEYDHNLRRLRYSDGNVSWISRNHYLSEWIRSAHKNKYLSLPLATDNTHTIRRVLSIISDLAPINSDIIATPYTECATRLSPQGSYFVGFITDRENLDYFHCGFLCKDKSSGKLIIRHAAKSAGGVTEGAFEDFCIKNDVKFVTVSQVL